MQAPFGWSRACMLTSGVLSVCCKISTHWPTRQESCERQLTPNAAQLQIHYIQYSCLLSSSCPVKLDQAKSLTVAHR